MHAHPQPDNLYESPMSLASPRPETPMFERDDLYVRERVAELQASAAAVHARGGAPVRAVARIRRLIGRGLIAVGAAVAGIELQEHGGSHGTSLAA